MSVTAENHVHPNSRIEALRVKHAELSRKVESEQRDLSTSDYYLNQLKKQKLLIKEEIQDEEKRAV
ncbi:MAG: YdcH family protein [Alphaproteobacteria bacterium]